MEIDEELLQRLTRSYAADSGAYRDFAELLREALSAACRRVAPGSFVEAWAKTKAGFAEEVVRLQPSFGADSISDLTGLCRARVVAPSSECVKAVCAYIEKNFIVDEKRSVRRPIRYVVQLRADEAGLEGVPFSRFSPRLARGPEGLKAEIEVRTVAEHVLASALHDRMDETALAQLPEALRRDEGRLSAALEPIDAHYRALASGVEDYLRHLSERLPREKLDGEIAILRAVSRQESDPNELAGLALRLAALAEAKDDWHLAVAELERVDGSGSSLENELKVELAHALLRRAECAPEHRDFLRAKAMLEPLAKASVDEWFPATGTTRNLRALAAFRLGWCLGFMAGGEYQAAQWLFKAWQLDRDNPHYLSAYLEFAVYASRMPGFVQAMEPILRDAIAACRRQVEMGIGVPRALLTAGRLQLLLGELAAAISDYVQAVARIVETGSPAGLRRLREEGLFLERLDAGHVPSDDHRFAASLVKLALQAAAAGKIDQPSGPPALIVAVGSSPAGRAEAYVTLLRRALGNANGRVIWNGKPVATPGHPAPGAVEGLLSSAREKGGPAEALPAWSELLQIGVRPKDVRLICIGGGPNEAFAMRFALALGARVGAVKECSGAADEIFSDHAWRDHPRLLALPPDGIDEATVRAFVRPSRFDLPPDALNRLGKLVHRSYLEMTPYAEFAFSPERLPWDELREDFRESNRQHILYAAEILASENLRLEPLAAGKPPAAFSAAQIERMAEKEHGRWCVERLASRWSQGPLKDPKRKITPYLCPYAMLGEDIKNHDRQAIERYAALFREGGFAIVQAPD